MRNEQALVVGTLQTGRRDAIRRLERDSRITVAVIEATPRPSSSLVGRSGSVQKSNSLDSSWRTMPQIP